MGCLKFKPDCLNSFERDKGLYTDFLGFSCVSDNSNAPIMATSPLKRGWTTGACATAATKSALHALLFDSFLDPVSITLPKGQTPDFALTLQERAGNTAKAAIVKDAGDDPDVTHGATIIAKVAPNKDQGICFFAGTGVGTVTLEGLPLAVGEPAINPVPRQMIRDVVEALCAKAQCAPHFDVTISVPGGAALAQKTWNPRLGIQGGLSILGTTGIVIPYSCAAWIDAIHRGIDVARAKGLQHLCGATGDQSAKVAQRALKLDDQAMIDMGDFVGGMLKYARKHAIKHITIAGGFAKLCKLAQGHMDLHSGRSQVDINFLAQTTRAIGGTAALADTIRSAPTAMQVLKLAANLPLAAHIAQLAQAQAQKIVPQLAQIDIMIIDREGKIRAHICA